MLVLVEHNRTFGYAVAASLALHALALAAHLPPRRAIVAPPPEPPLVAHLVEAPPPAPPAAAKEEPPKPKPTRPKPVAKPVPAPRPSPPVARPAAPAEPPRVAEAPPVPEGVEQGSAELAPLAPPPPPVAAARAPAVAAIAPAPAAPAKPDPAAELARFRQQLVDVAVRYKRYPRMALDNGWTGDVVVRVDVAASGAVTSVQVKASSGYNVLDEQALEMFRRAAPAVQVPAALRGKDFSVEVRAIYNLQDRPG
jgi:protein TonB